MRVASIRATLLEYRHQEWNLIGSRKGKTFIDEIDLLYSPAHAMNPADIVCRKLMIPIIAIDEIGHCADLFLQHDTAHLALHGNAKEVTKNFYNQWVDATGVSDMTDAACVISGERL